MRRAHAERATAETKVAVDLDLDGSGRASIETGVGFFDHLLGALSRHSMFDLTVRASGDLGVDAHHTVEDTGIVLGRAFRQALGDGAGIARFASLHLPMDDALVLVALDVSGRPYLESSLSFSTGHIGAFATDLVEETLRGFAMHAAVTLHINQVRGRNSHHIAEAVFKGLGVALGRATRVVGSGVPSTKGML